MTITTQDIKIFKSEVIADTADGGGRMTGNEVVDGELNNLFDDSSRLDRVNGRVSLRKFFGALVTTNTDKFLGAHAIITRPALDGRVVCTLLDLKDHADRRAVAKAFVEKYLIAGVETQLTLYSNQPAETRTVIAYIDLSDPLPAVGDVYCLSVEQIGNANFGKEQFVRVLNVSSVSVSSTDAGGLFTKRLVTMGISEALEITFPGLDLLRAPQPSSRITRVRKAEINPQANFYGIVPSAEAIDIGDTALKVSTILQSIVPASYSETPLLDRQVGASIQAAVAAGPAFTQTFSTVAVAGTLGVNLLRPALPGSVTVVADAASADNDVTLTDAGGGVLTRSTGGAGTGTTTGSVVYAAGQISLAGLPNVAYTVTVSYVPSVAVTDVQHTSAIPITLANRGFNYAQTLLPKPAPGAVVVNYRALGNWYVLTDNGKGQLVGPAGTGAGTVNYLTGTVNVTVGYQPDVNSPVLFGWGTGVHYAQAIASVDADLGAVNGFLSAEAGLVPGTVVVSWNDGAAKSATDNGQGLLSGDATGTVEYVSGRVTITPNALVPAGTSFTIAATKKPVVSDTLTPVVSGANVEFTLSTVPAEADTLQVEAIYRRPNGQSVLVKFRERGSVFKQLTGVGSNARGVVGAGNLVGSVNLVTGTCVLPNVLLNSYRSHGFDGISWDDGLDDITFDSLVIVSYADADGAPAASSTTLNQTSLRVDFSRGLNVGAVPGSLLFTLNGRIYYDLGGTLYYRNGSNVETAAGSFDYLTGIGTVTNWLAGAFTASVQSLLSKYGQWLMSSVVWRTDGEPIRALSFQVTDGISVSSANIGGILSGGFATGTISLEDGVYTLTFPTPIVPELARYNAVALTYLPSDPEILGINAVRLPLDGRVPIFRPGGTLVLLNDQTTALPNPVIAGTTYTLPRNRLAYAVLYDANGLKIPTDRYTTTNAELDAGEITMANPLDLSGYVQPLVVEHRIEDMVRCVDAQLSGDVQISGDITHAYPLTGTYLASAKLYGDLQGHAFAPFSQQAWTGEWSDVQIGADTSGQYNNAAYPITVTNAGAITERWRIEFTSPTAFRLIGETVGQIATGDTSLTFVPVNPATGAAYFTVPAAGWGSGWTAGNQVRLNTTAAAAAGWLLRCTLQGPESEPTDSFRIQFRGDN